MIEKEVTVVNKKGLHARPATILIGLVEKFNVVLTVAKGEEKVNVDRGSILRLLMLAAVEGTVLKITVEGAEAVDAMAEFEKFFNKQEEELIS
jgi:phosphotransferase system HPr (HPr) family protein